MIRRIAVTVNSFVCAALFMLMPAIVCANTSAEKAAAFFGRKEYSEAVAIWYGMVATGNSSAGLYYNIGLAESQLRNTPKAMLGFEKALRLKPMNKEIKSAILEERKRIENATIPVDPFFLKEWYKGGVTFLRPGYWSLLGLVLLALAVFSFLMETPEMKAVQNVKSRMRIYLSILGLCLVSAGFLSYKEIYREDEGVVTEQCAIRQAPADDSPQIRIVYPGEKIIITDQIGGWYNVQLLNLDTGWLKKECLIPIKISKN